MRLAAPLATPLGGSAVTVHERTQIRDAIVSALTAVTDAEDRVLKARAGPLPQTELPALCVYTDDEPVDGEHRTAPREYKRRLSVKVEAWADLTGVGDLDAVLDDLALDIEFAMDADVWFGGCVSDSWLSNTEKGETMLGKRPVGCVRLTYDVMYYTNIRKRPVANEVPFRTANTTFELPDTTPQSPPVVDRTTDIY